MIGKHPEMNAYSEFINETFNIISRILPSSDNKLFQFACAERSSAKTNDYARLVYSKAALFYALMTSYSDSFGIDKSVPSIERSRIYPEVIYIYHGCYPKNLRRWMNGQKSRKTLNRAEYVVLLYCWSIDWYGNDYINRSHTLCREELTALCKRIVGDAEKDNDLLALLWSASCKSYSDAYDVASSK